MDEQTKSDIIIAFHQLYLESLRRSLEVEPLYKMTNYTIGKKKNSQEFLMNRKQLSDYVGRVIEHTLKHLGEKYTK